MSLDLTALRERVIPKYYPGRPRCDPTTRWRSPGDTGDVWGNSSGDTHGTHHPVGPSWDCRLLSVLRWRGVRKARGHRHRPEVPSWPRRPEWSSFRQNRDDHHGGGTRSGSERCPDTHPCKMFTPLTSGLCVAHVSTPALSRSRPTPRSAKGGWDFQGRLYDDAWR